MNKKDKGAFEKIKLFGRSNTHLLFDAKWNIINIPEYIYDDRRAEYE